MGYSDLGATDDVELTADRHLVHEVDGGGRRVGREHDVARHERRVERHELEQEALGAPAIQEEGYSKRSGTKLLLCIKF